MCCMNESCQTSCPHVTGNVTRRNETQYRKNQGIQDRCLRRAETGKTSETDCGRKTSRTCRLRESEKL